MWRAGLPGPAGCSPFARLAWLQSHSLRSWRCWLGLLRRSSSRSLPSRCTKHRSIEVEHHPIGAVPLPCLRRWSTGGGELQQHLPLRGLLHVQCSEPVRHIQAHFIVEGRVAPWSPEDVARRTTPAPRSSATAEAQRTLQQIERQPERLGLVIGGLADPGRPGAVRRSRCGHRLGSAAARTSGRGSGSGGGQHHAREERMAPA